MKVIQVHNYYQQAGGEDAVVSAERELLLERGHEVVPYYKRNDRIKGGLYLLVLGVKTIWNWEIYREFRTLLQKKKPDVVHCHNTFPLISPAIYWACAKEKVPVVQTLHNYRLLCLNAFLFLEDRGVCERCVKKRFKFPGILRRCYRNSLSGSLVVATMLLFHRVLGTWSRKVSAYLALTSFQKDLLVRGGVPSEKVWVKPNFMRNTLSSARVNETKQRNSYILYVGRVSAEKGVELLLYAWEKLKNKSEGKLKIVGDGPQKKYLEELAFNLGLDGIVEFCGKRTFNEVQGLMEAAYLLVVPSICYETFGLVVLEAAGKGCPALVCDLGGVASLIEDGRTGLHFKMGSKDALVERLEWALAHPNEMGIMGQAAQRRCKELYSVEKNYTQLLESYQRVQNSGPSASQFID